MNNYIVMMFININKHINTHVKTIQNAVELYTVCVCMYVRCILRISIIVNYLLNIIIVFILFK